jgi:hypothetical protein
VGVLEKLDRCTGDVAVVSGWADSGAEPSG